MRPLWLVVALLALACGGPPRAVYPTSFDVYAETGKGHFAGEKSDDFRTGISVHFVIDYGEGGAEEE